MHFATLFVVAAAAVASVSASEQEARTTRFVAAPAAAKVTATARPGGGAAVNGSETYRRGAVRASKGGNRAAKPSRVGTVVGSVVGSLVPSLAPSLASNVFIGMGECAAAMPDCAAACFIKAGESLGCAADDLICQCQQQGRLMSGAEECVSSSCAAGEHQKVIDGALQVCRCAVGQATAGIPSMIARAANTASFSGTVVSQISGRGSVVPSMGSVFPSGRGSVQPTQRGSIIPTQRGSIVPTQRGSIVPTQRGSIQPTQRGSIQPTARPSLPPVQPSVPAPPAPPSNPEPAIPAPSFPPTPSSPSPAAPIATAAANLAAKSPIGTLVAALLGGLLARRALR